MLQLALKKTDGRAELQIMLAPNVLTNLSSTLFRVALQATPMVFETTFWIVFVAAGRMIAKAYDRRRDVLYGPYLRRAG